MKSRILNVEHMIKKRLEKCKGCDYISVVVGRYKGDKEKSNLINILPVIDDEGDYKRAFMIETTIKDVNYLAELVLSVLLRSKLKFKTVKVANMDGSKIDKKNPKTDLEIAIRL